MLAPLTVRAFYAQDRSNLSQVTEALVAQGFEQIAGYERAL
jgi:hypothetical protein